jgi:CRISPR-associated protein (TIGR02710 family)
MAVLIMTVGTGTGSDPSAATRDLAHGLVHSISQHEPERIVFFGSAQSQAVIAEIERLYQDKNRRVLPPHEFIGLTNIDDFDTCFQQIWEVFGKYRDKSTITYYTSGTKTMSVSAAVAAFLAKSELYVTGGARQNGKVLPGTERVSQQSLYRVTNHLLLDSAKSHFNNHHFLHAREILGQTVGLPDYQHYEALFTAYESWDRLDYQRANVHLSTLKDERLKKNLAFLGQITSMKDKKRQYLFALADLINNAERRIRDGRHDDAVARLYRAVELIAQIKLMELGIDDTDGKIALVDVKKKVKDQDWMMRCEGRSDEGYLRIGSFEKYKLLEKAGWIGAESAYKRLETDLRKRNESILAHGLKPIDKEAATSMAMKVRDLATREFSVLPKILEDATFVTL